jgi:signal transduction histidine kinase
MNCRRIVHIICADGTLARKYRRELECGGEAYEFRLSPSQVGALRDFSAGESNVILLDESATGDALKLVVEELAMAAPVVAVAAAGRQTELRRLIASGTVDFVPRSGDFLSLAAQAVGRRMQSAREEDVNFGAANFSRDFGEILRHEVNNPLTGILGNAELLLARRDGLPPAAIERVETIAGLAVRLRETVWRLSHAWDERPVGPA